MFLNRLSLQNFRSYFKSSFNFSSGINIIVGPNTSGKTNIIEAIFLLSRGKSFRADKDLEMIGFGKDISRVMVNLSHRHPELDSGSESEIKGEMLKPFDKTQGGQAQHDKTTTDDDISLEVILTTGLVNNIKVPFKKFLVNNVSKRRVDFCSNLRTVLFNPEDLEIIIGSPSLRRNFLDEVLEQVDREYAFSSISYSKALRQRNALLERIKESGVRNEREFEYWDELLIRNGMIISEKRRLFIEFINDAKKDIFDFEMVYDKSEISKARLLQYKDAEIGAGVTLVGPHRDDLCILMHANENNPNVSESGNPPSPLRGEGWGEGEGVDIKSFGSRGQQRLVILQLKLLQIIFMEKNLNEHPLLLLDDIFSELDEGHINLVLKMIGKNQTIITTTHEEFIPKKIIPNAQLIELK